MSTIIWTALLFALETRAAGGLSSEFRAGYAPSGVGATEQATAVSSTNPSLTVFAFDDVKTMSLSYSPRILFREPNIENEFRPVVFHQAAFNTSHRLSRKVTAGLGATGGVGELDYTGLQQALGNTGGSVPRTNRIAQAAVHGQLKLNLAPRTVATSDIRASLFAPLMEPAPQTNNLLPRQSMIDFGTLLTTQVLANSSVGAGARAAYYRSSNGLRLLVFTPGVELSHPLREVRGDLRASAGVAFIRDLADSVPGKRSESRVLPMSGIQMSNRLVEGKGMKLSSDLGFGTTFFVDPTLGKGRLRGQANGGLRATFSREWSARFEATFSTSLMKNPLVLGDSLPVMADSTMVQYPYETQLMLVLPVRWQTSADFSMEAGVRHFKRGPHLAAPSNGQGEQESWIYMLATLGFDFTRVRPGSTPR